MTIIALWIQIFFLRFPWISPIIIYFCKVWILKNWESTETQVVSGSPNFPPSEASHLITGGQSIHKTFGFGFSTQEDFARSHLAGWPGGYPAKPIRCGQMIVFCSMEGCHSLEFKWCLLRGWFFWKVKRIEHNISIWVWYIIIWKASRWRSSNVFYFGLLHLRSIPTNLLGTMQHPLTIFDPINSPTEPQKFEVCCQIYGNFHKDAS